MSCDYLFSSLPVTQKLFLFIQKILIYISLLGRSISVTFRALIRDTCTIMEKECRNLTDQKRDSLRNN